MRRKRLKILFIAFLFALIAAAGTGYYVLTSRSALAAGLRRYAADTVNTLRLPACPDPEQLFQYDSATLYVDNKPAAQTAFQQGKDNKLVLETADKTVLFDYAMGYYVDLPAGTDFDFSKSPKFTTIQGDGFTGVISKERSTESDVSAYTRHYFNRFILDQNFQRDNRVNVTEDVQSGNSERITLAVEDFGGQYDRYSYIIIKTDGRFFYRVMLRYSASDQTATDTVQMITDSFSFFRPKGKPVYDLDLRRVTPENWSAETRELYESITAPDAFRWGIFTEDVMETGIAERIPALEEKLEYRFDIVLAYIHLNMEFPAEFMQRCFDEGRLVEMTYQLTVNNNLDLYARSPVLDLYRGEEHEQIRAFAKAAKAFGHPFLFRLNNEMNSDWTSYGGVNNLQDPDIFVNNWRTVYRIFEEEGVDNAIWIFNPNDRDYPPNAWNSYIAYYPGDEYVQMLGVTGYNNGDYYRDVTGESWREFRTIYDNIEEEFSGLFGHLPWIITEFASSSAGGDKARWITRMFDDIRRYPNIKAAVWFSFADYDFRPEYEGRVARPYWLDETPDTLDAFKRGLIK